jgi:hypothetical protein
MPIAGKELSLQIKALKLLPIEDENLALGFADKFENALAARSRNRAGNRFDCQAEVIRNVAPRHWQRHIHCSGSAIHLDQESGNPFNRTLTA